MYKEWIHSATIKNEYRLLLLRTAYSFIRRMDYKVDFESSYIDPLVDDWMENLRQSLKEHIELHSLVGGAMAFSALQEIAIQQFFNIATFLELDANVKWLAIQLYDMFIIKHFTDTYELSVLHNSIDFWTQSIGETIKKVNLYVLSCFKIASKLETRSHCLGLPQFYEILRMMGDRAEYPPGLVLSSELEVFKQIGFKVSFCTPLQCLEILLAVTGLINTPNTYGIATGLLDLAYLKHETLYFQFCFKYVVMYNIPMEVVGARALELKKNMLHMSSAIVLCATSLLCASTSDANEEVFTLKLAELSNTTFQDVKIMADLLLRMAFASLRQLPSQRNEIFRHAKRFNNLYNLNNMF